LLGKSVERLNPHAGIDQYIVDFGGTYNGILRGGQYARKERKKKRREDSSSFHHPSRLDVAFE